MMFMKLPISLQSNHRLENLFPSATEAMEVSQSEGNGVVASVVRWLVRQVRASVRSELSQELSVEQRYLAKDDTAERMKSQS